MEQLWSKAAARARPVAGGGVVHCGLALLGTIFGRWAASGFGALHEEHPALLGLTLIGLGVQILFGSFFLDVLGLRKHIRFGDAPPPIIVEDELEALDERVLHTRSELETARRR